MVVFQVSPSGSTCLFWLAYALFFDAPQSAESLWASYQPVAETSAWQHITLTTDKQTNIHAPGRIRTHNLSRRAAEDLRPRPRGHWDRQHCYCSNFPITEIETLTALTFHIALRYATKATNEARHREMKISNALNYCSLSHNGWLSPCLPAVLSVLIRFYLKVWKFPR